MNPGFVDMNDEEGLDELDEHEFQENVVMREQIIAERNELRDRMLLSPGCGNKKGDLPPLAGPSLTANGVLFLVYLWLGDKSLLSWAFQRDEKDDSSPFEENGGVVFEEQVNNLIHWSCIVLAIFVSINLVFEA